MPSARGRGYSTVEVRPDGPASTSKSNIAPSSPTSPKAVRFAPFAKAEPRELTQGEAWSLYHFESHARRCRYCYNPLDVATEGRKLCDQGFDLAQDVAEHVYRADGVVYSRKKDNYKLVEVELPSDYSQVRQLLRWHERLSKSSRRKAPVIDYESSYPATSRRANPDIDELVEKLDEVVIEPAQTEMKSRRKSRQKSTKYKTVVVEEAVPAPTTRRSTLSDGRRGSLYWEDMQRERRAAYNVEIREPERTERRRDGGLERPRSGFWL